MTTAIRDFEIKKTTKRWIEQEIYDYHQTKKYIEELTEDIIHATPEKNEIRGSETFDPTFIITSLIATNNTRNMMIQTLHAIDLARKITREDALEILEYKYWVMPCASWLEVSDRFNISDRQAYRFRNAFIYEVSKNLGMK